MEPRHTPEPTDPPYTASRASRTEQLRLVADWQASGQTQAAFARAQGIAVHRLRYWASQAKRRAESDEAKATDDGFDEYPVQAVAATPDAKHVLHLRNASGAVVELALAPSVSAAFVSAIIQEALR